MRVGKQQAMLQPRGFVSTVHSRLFPLRNVQSSPHSADSTKTFCEYFQFQ